MVAPHHLREARPTRNLPEKSAALSVARHDKEHATNQKKNLRAGPGEEHQREEDGNALTENPAPLFVRSLPGDCRATVSHERHALRPR